MECLEEIVENHEQALRNFAWSLTGSETLIDDLLQDVWIKCLNNLLILSAMNQSKQRSWLFTVLKNHYFDICRHQKMESVKLKLIDYHTPQEIQDVYNWEPYLNLLSDKEKEIILLRFWEGLNSKEIGEKLKMSDNTVRWHLSNGLKSLRNICEKKWR